MCWPRSESAACRTARELWPTAAMESSLSWEHQSGFMRFYQRGFLPRVRAVLTG